MPALPGKTHWDLIWALTADRINEKPVVTGQPLLRLKPTPSNERHAIGIRVDNLSPGATYRVSVLVKAPYLQIQVRDLVDQKTGQPSHYGEARFNLSSGIATMTQGDMVVDGVTNGKAGWKTVDVNIPTADGTVFIYVGLLSRDGTSHVFAGHGEAITFGGFEVRPAQHKN